MKFGEVSDNIKVLPYYNKKITIVNKEDKPIRFQIPRLYMPFGISGFVAPTGPTKWNIDFSLKGFNEDGNYIKKFYEFLKNFDENIITEVQKQSVDIFNRDVPLDELRQMYNSNIKEDPQGVWEPKFRVKIDEDCNIFNENDVQIENEFVDHLYARNTGVAIVEPQSVYFMQKRFGITWKVYQLKVYEPQQLKGFQFRDVPPPPAWGCAPTYLQEGLQWLCCAVFTTQELVVAHREVPRVFEYHKVCRRRILCYFSWWTKMF